MIEAAPYDGVAFAPFGAFVEAPALAGERAHYGEWVEPIPGRSLQLHRNRVAASAFPITVDRVERHPHAAQLFLPVGGSRFLVTVMPSTPDGGPDPAGAMAFVVPGDVGVVYRPGVWHTGIAVLDRPGSFAVVMWRNGEDDDDFVEVPPFQVVEEGST